MLPLFVARTPARVLQVWRHTNSRCFCTVVQSSNPRRTPVRTTTPAMSQYYAVKDDPRYAGAIVLFQMGDFFEMFDDCARTASEVLGITLTQRKRRGKSEAGTPLATPMCGFPVHVKDTYVSRLVRAGLRVVVVDQVESVDDARRRGASLVARAVTSVVTAGTVSDDTMLAPGSHNYLAALHLEGADSDRVAVAWTDVSTGAYFTTVVPVASLSAVLTRYPPSELVVPESWLAETGVGEQQAVQVPLSSLAASVVESGVLRMDGCVVSTQPDAVFEAGGGKALLDEASVVHSGPRPDLSPEEFSAMGGLLAYVSWTQQGQLPSLVPNVSATNVPVLEMDASTLRSLELTAPVGGERGQPGSLLNLVDRCRTPSGSRLLESRLRVPSACADGVRGRLDAVQWLLDRPHVRDVARELLDQCSDIERALQRLSMGKASPLDLGSIRDTLAVTARLGRLLQTEDAVHWGKQADAARTTPGPTTTTTAAAAFTAATRGFDVSPGRHPDDAASVIDMCCQSLLLADATVTAVVTELNAALVESPPASRLSVSSGVMLPLKGRVGGFSAPEFVRRGYCPELDAVRDLRDRNHRQSDALQSQYQQQAAGVTGLTVRHLQKTGFVLEVPSKSEAALLAAVPDAAPVTGPRLKSRVRFKTPALVELDHKAATADADAAAVEADIFRTLCALVSAAQGPLFAIARSVAVVDVCAALAHVAARDGLVRPHVGADPSLAVTDGRHPVVQHALERDAHSFVPNDVALGTGDAAANMWLVTGPNMGGKSTFLRQNALLVILAQAGAYVPASGAAVGLVDRLFTRVGASDDLSRGRSTFMVEMEEVANILANATPQSLVILDEVGRGTSSTDGLAIAWAVVSDLVVRVGCRGLFATHFHELAAIAPSQLPPGRLKCVSMGVHNTPVGPVLSHKVVDGAVSSSFGINVARRAGLPPAVIRHAESILKGLDEAEASALWLKAVTSVVE